MSADEATSHPVDMVLSLHREGTVRLLRTMRSHHVMPPFCHPWGSERAYLALLRGACSLTLLDVPDGAATFELEGRVRLLRDFTTVVVLTPRHIDAVSLLRAGAVNVLPRDTPPMELASRLIAERRWLVLSAARGGLRAPPRSEQMLSPRQMSQQVLFGLLASATRPWCCHDLCLLLGNGPTPLSRRALQGRMVRLGERLAEHGMSVLSSHQWGRTTYMGIHEIPVRQREGR
ncbi:hypothetical protein Z951_31060 [Streptomyces sp. PRh5]|uniref:hypothetical protein n=1 Tax=Streptomyces sp. PRh5 TaxID=1158056 RepID=UPI00044FA404|nr:hypothetical protein [Streptomyces sp. PRh5]EXU64392.1 hypothetical protein Z951_31060 [Streptomyces sp. PRh5]